MAYNEDVLNRIREWLYNKKVAFNEKAMFGGMCILVDEKMFCATHVDKKTQKSLLLCRIGEDAWEAALERPDCIPMEFTKRTMPGYVYALEEGFNTKKGLDYWLQLCLAYNPLAKKSGRR